MIPFVPVRGTGDGNENCSYRVIPKSAGTLFALILRAEFGPVVTPRVKKISLKKKISFSARLCFISCDNEFQSIGLDTEKPVCHSHNNIEHPCITAREQRKKHSPRL